MNPHVFSLAMGELSDRYIEEALDYQAPRRQTRPLLQAALAACLMVLIGFGTAFALSTSFRATVTGWFRDTYYSFNRYVYKDGEAVSSFIPGPYELCVLPEGYTEVINQYDAGTQMSIWDDGSDHPLVFSLTSGGSAYVETTGYTVSRVLKNGIEYELYQPQDPARDTCIVWTRSDMFFYISGYLTAEEILWLAENVRPVQ